MPDQFNEDLGRLIRSAREKRLTQAALGAHVGLSRTAITNIECGRQRLLVDQLVAIADALDVAPAELIPASPQARANAAQDMAVVDMPTVQKWITTVKRSTSRSRT
jgi:transcriptional regulator with XRE-family HTH domain